nr:aconitate hydratase AcnA [uncultured Holophaga sp.]
MASPSQFDDTRIPLEGLGTCYSIPALSTHLGRDLSRLPVSIRIVLESVLRNCGKAGITPEHVTRLADWKPQAERTEEIPFVVSRVVLQDFTGVPLLADLAAMRDTTREVGHDPERIEPLVPVDLVVDHSVMIDHFASKDALKLNMELEFQRNHERYAFMKWGMDAFETFKVVPPGFGIVHQINLEYLAPGVHRSPEGVLYPDTLVGTDSHTTMINGVGVVAWGVGGIEAEAAMLGQPVFFLTPDVVGFELKGKLREGVTATDLVLTVTEILRKAKVVGKFVEFFGEGAESLTVPDRATLANMAPEYGATMGFFPVDGETVTYFKATGRKRKALAAFEAYFRAQGLFGIPRAGAIDYSQVITLELSEIVPSLAGPRRPQDRIEIGKMAGTFAELFAKPVKEGGFGLPAERLSEVCPAGEDLELHHGDVLIAAITSCTNTSNPGVMLAAGLLARNAVAAGLSVPPHIKTSLAPGSRIVTEYLEDTGLLKPLAKLGFALAAYGCTTCIGNSGELAPAINEAIARHDLVGAAVLSGNRNFEARIHPAIKANFLASPPLVVAYAIAGTVTRDLLKEPLGLGKDGKPVFLKDIWPKAKELRSLMKKAMKPKAFRENYAKVETKPGKLWDRVKGVSSPVYTWPASTYIARPPFFEGFTLAEKGDFTPGVRAARVMALFGDSVTTDHISPAGSIKPASPAGQYLLAQGVAREDFNSYGSRRGNHEVMMRGTFANVRIRNLMLPTREDGSREEGGLTLHQPSGEKLYIYDAAMRYQAEGISTVVFAGEEYGTGSSRDWAAKGTQLLGIKAVVARSFERIHRANLVGMGILPLQFMAGESWETLGITGQETVDIELDPELKPQSEARLILTRSDGSVVNAWVKLRIDTPIEVDYYRSGGILPFVLRGLLG